MGQEISHSGFSAAERDHFSARLETETSLLEGWLQEGELGAGGYVAGLELEACLVDDRMRPAACNEAFLERFHDPLASAELARFNIELNSPPHPVGGDFLRRIHDELAATWRRCHETAAEIGARVVMTGILPTLQPTDLCLANMSPMVRYRALNEEVLAARRGRPLHLNISGREHLLHDHHDVMLESATTSFQLHLQVEPRRAARYYNAALIATAPLVAACANSPYLFGRDLWDETRIPLFEQTVEIGGFDAAVFGPVRRATFGSGYVRDSLFELFRENQAHYPPLLPTLLDEPAERLPHLILHNGTIWRWNRPLVGFDSAGRPHLRIEHRSLPAGPSVVDSVANAALCYGLLHALADSEQPAEERLPFATARDNFYRAAEHGLDTTITWFDGERVPLSELLLERLLPQARNALRERDCSRADLDDYLGVIDERLRSGRTGAAWQRAYIARHGADFTALSHALYQGERSGEPVHRWPL